MVLELLEASCTECKSENIERQSFSCFEESPTFVTYRARLEGTSETESDSLISLIEDWVRGGGASVIVTGILMTVDSHCSVAISFLSEPECSNPTPTSVVTSREPECSNPTPTSVVTSHECSKLTPSSIVFPTTSSFPFQPPLSVTNTCTFSDNTPSIVAGVVVAVVAIMVTAVTVISITLVWKRGGAPTKNNDK